MNKGLLKTAATLKISEERFNRMITEVKDYAILFLSREGIIENWNQGAEKIIGYQAEEIIGKNFSLFYTEQDRQSQLPKKLLAEAELNGRAVHEGWRVRKNGSKFWGSIVITALHDNDTNIIGFSKVTRDLTDKKLADDQILAANSELEQKNIELEKINRELLDTAATLKISEERYNRMITEVKDYAILFLSKEGIIENWNQGAEKIKGYRAEEIIGRNFSLFYTEQDRQSHLPAKLLAEAEQNGTAVHEGWRVRKNGSKFWGSIVITALHDNDANIIGFSKVTRDLTDKKLADDKILAANSELEQNNIELEKLNKELESINYISSHDLQEPLRQIQVFTGRIIDVEQNLSDKGKFYFERMNIAAKRMQNLISDLLSYSQTKTEIRKWQIVNLNEIVNEVMEELVEVMEGNHSIIVAGELGNVNVIPFQFRQMIYNLIGNALKFSKPNTPPQIVIKNEKVKSSQVPGAHPATETDYFHISIADNGIGFEPQYKDRIFEVFQRLHDKQKIAGTGIGLAIVKNIVANHNGFITATGELNKGATFDIYLPIIQIH